ncbi:hydroxysteroid dehydrogenase-like protein 1 [Uranotaenia lowii]|uniref:hydroxysteroid dehydrogenase-like protein 1 n=1 Tax=Uranotaenia lowii TaxID=190385 RepID=UPI00247AB738|nr:hydroxysteroid dehydrogenase-like protein 1 [Uranotaenia lowii]
MECIFGSWLNAIGLYAIVIFLIDTLKSPLSYLLYSIIGSRKPLPEKYGKWAVITGSSDGIGKEYAAQLAKAKMNLLLISRSETKLAKIAVEFRIKYGVEVKYLVIDFSDGAEVYDKIQEAIKDLEVGVLVNNVGMLNDQPIRFDKISKEEIQHTFTVNMLSTARMTHLVLPEMRRRRRGIIINIASGAGELHVGFATMYSSSKAFVISFTKAMQQELIGSGVECQLVKTLMVDTKMVKEWQRSGPTGLFIADLHEYGKSAFATIGKISETTGCTSHAIQLMVSHALPDWFVTFWLSFYMRFMTRMNNKARRAQKEAELKQ